MVSKPSDDSYLVVTAPNAKGYLEEVCLLKDRYLPLNDVCNEPDDPAKFSNGPQTDEPKDDVLKLLQQQFTPSQISKLMDMLTKMQVRDDSNSTKSLSYLVTKTAGTLNDSM